MQRLTLAALAFYQRHVTARTPACPQTPSCSQYAVDAVRAYGARRGIDLAHARLTACKGRAGG